MNAISPNLEMGGTYLETKMQSHAPVLECSMKMVSYLTERNGEVSSLGCSGGGGRNDLGMMRYFPQVWASDNTDAIARLQSSGSSYLYQLYGGLTYQRANHQMGRMTPRPTRGHVVMMKSGL